MEIAVIVLSLCCLGFGGWVVVLIRGQVAVRDELGKLRGAGEMLRADNERISAESGRFRSELESLETQSRAQSEESARRVSELSVLNAQLRERLDGAEKRYLDLVNDEKRLTEQFESIGGKSLRANQEALSKFLTDHIKGADQLSQKELDERKTAVEELVRPIRETLDKTHEQISKLDERVKASGESNTSLREETARLSKALGRPEIRGRYGEIQLQRVAELAGMTQYCDFELEHTHTDDEGVRSRPDMEVKLPNERVIVVDAKTNIHAYLEAVNAQSEEEREKHLNRFAKHITDQAKDLSSKRYWAQLKRSPEFVVMFVPGDHFIDAALARNPNLLDFAAERHVILATPSTLIGLLRAVAVGWRDQALTEQANELLSLGSTLHERASVAFKHILKIGKLIDQTSRTYDELVGSVDSRLVPTLRKFEDAGAKSKVELSELKPVQRQTRVLNAGAQASDNSNTEEV